MIIHHQDNIAAFAGGQTFYWPTQPLFFQRVTITSAAPTLPPIDEGMLVGGLQPLAGGLA